MALQATQKKMLVLVLSLVWLGGPLIAVAFMFLSPVVSPPAEPGNIPSPTLARLLNESIEGAISQMNPNWSPGLIPEAAANTRTFLGEVSEVVARCSMGPHEPNQKWNKLEYHLTRVDGVRYKPIYTGIRCGRSSLIYRAVFKDGQVVEAYTDGSERQRSLEEVRGIVRPFGKGVTWSDRDYHPERYFRPKPTAPSRAELEKQWE
ncbi:hypothetical protein [Comamonas sp. JC664]|uniref:hypothetical protein n=1 Tax=Comamonas sp. JC664 TaxID=2801917 RepID=UPI0019202E9D|nr:hypothetical protein [Comamonas sp. JC664]MBL0696172.1 hypothetical protein [Comamonas sp. JC664]GHG65707.1 hypothetical protein GCM10012319_07050 [Comamonas sp. KCTC 72670]